MKKISIIILLFSLFFVTGCGCSKKELKTVTCKLDVEETEYTMKIENKIVYNSTNNVVEKIEENGEVLSDDSINLNAIKRINDEAYKTYSDLKHATYSSSISDGKLIMNFSVDLSKVNMDEYIAANSDNKKIVSDNKVDYLKLVEYYGENGFKCDEI